MTAWWWIPIAASFGFTAGVLWVSIVAINGREDGEAGSDQ